MCMCVCGGCDGEDVSQDSGLDIWVDVDTMDMSERAGLGKIMRWPWL